MVERIFGRFLQFLILFFGIVFVVYTGSVLFVMVSFFGFLFLGSIFEQILISKIKRPRYKKLKVSAIIQSLIYVHFMVDFFAKYDAGVYEFSNREKFIRNLLVYLIVSLYLIISSLLFILEGYYGLLVYLIPAITNVISFWKYNYQII